MKIAIFLALAVALMPLVYSDNSTTDLVKGNFTAATSGIQAVAIQDNNENLRCAKEFECRVASYSEKNFWFGCYFDSSDNECKCYKGDITDCDLGKGSVSKDDWCAYQYECVENGDGLYQFNCYFDGQCKCYVGDFDQCREDKSLVNKSEVFVRKEPSKVNITLDIAPVKEADKVNVSETPVSFFSVKNPVFFWGMISVGLAVFLVILIILAKGASEDNLVKARRFHRKAEELHDKGMEDEAHKYYKLAEEHRSQARGSE